MDSINKPQTGKSSVSKIEHKIWVIHSGATKRGCLHPCVGQERFDLVSEGFSMRNHALTI